MAIQSKVLTVTNPQECATQVPDVVVHGDPGLWVCLGKAASPAQGWMKSTKVLPVDGLGCLVQVTTQQGDRLAEALTWVPGAALLRRDDGSHALVQAASLAYVTPSPAPLPADPGMR
jgi:hypothetical protein